jgi:hypothetical protein
MGPSHPRAARLSESDGRRGEADETKQKQARQDKTTQEPRERIEDPCGR